MFFLGLEGLLLANLLGLAAAKVSTDAVSRETDAGPQPRSGGFPPGYQPHYAAQRASYDPRGGEVRLDASPAGHFYANVEIDGCHAMMMIDTGATGLVIGHKFARKLGFDLTRATYDTPVRTGGGRVMACRFTLPLIMVEGIHGRDIDSIVHERETATDEVCDGLIGQSFLRQIHVEQRGGSMILRP